MKANIILIGFMGCGKTTTGKMLAQSMNYRFLDTDNEIEKDTNMNISRIFEKYGEKNFRDMETDILKKVVKTEHTVISTGGGIILKECNANILKESGFIIYLKIKDTTVKERLKNDITRPLLKQENTLLKIGELLSYREPLYEAVAHVTIEVDNKSVEEIMEEIQRNFQIIMYREKEKRGCNGTR